MYQSPAGTSAVSDPAMESAATAPSQFFHPASASASTIRSCNDADSTEFRCARRARLAFQKRPWARSRRIESGTSDSCRWEESVRAASGVAQRLERESPTTASNSATGFSNPLSACLSLPDQSPVARPTCIEKTASIIFCADSSMSMTRLSILDTK